MPTSKIMNTLLNISIIKFIIWVILLPIIGTIFLLPYYIYLGVNLNIGSIAQLMIPGYILLVIGLFFITMFFCSPILTGFIVRRTIGYPSVVDNRDSKIIQGLYISRHLLLAGLIFCSLLISHYIIKNSTNADVHKMFWIIPFLVAIVGFSSFRKNEIPFWKTNLFYIVWAIAINALTIFWGSLIACKNAPMATIFNMIAMWFILTYLSSFALFDLKNDFISLAKKYFWICLFIFSGIFCTSIFHNPILAEKSGRLASGIFFSKWENMKINILDHNSCKILRKICANEVLKTYKGGSCSLGNVFLVNNIGDTYHVLVKAESSAESVADNEYWLLTMSKNNKLKYFKGTSRETLKDISIVN